MVRGRFAMHPARDLYNGQPGTVARWLDALDSARGERVLHIGCGSGYYAGILAETVGPTGRVFAVEVDQALARTAGKNLEAWQWVEVQNGGGTTALPADADVVIVHAGASHLCSEWLASTRAERGSMCPSPWTSLRWVPTLGKGLTFLLTRVEDGWTAKALSFVAIHSMQSARDPSAAERFGEAMRQGGWDRVTRHAPTRMNPGQRVGATGPTPACLRSAGVKARVRGLATQAALRS